MIPMSTVVSRTQRLMMWASKGCGDGRKARPAQLTLTRVLRGSRRANSPTFYS
jgi:hypothetical protein